MTGILGYYLVSKPKLYNMAGVFHVLSLPKASQNPT